MYRIYFHPLEDFCGHPEARISDTWLYRATKTGHAEEVFEKLRQELNTKALRIAPNELHITDVGLYKVIYSHTAPFLKDAEFYEAFNTPHTLFELDPLLHRERRRMLASMFSRATVYKLEPLIREKLFVVMDKITRSPEANQHV
ncbi:hypothetical protein BDW69DRAFT_188802 [Aspergillus filifer]